MANSGFGSGPFGDGPFGEFDWSRYILFDLLPSQHKLSDPSFGGLHDKIAEGFKQSLTRMRDKINNYDDINNPLQVSTKYSDNLFLTLGRVIVNKGIIEQSGIDGTATTTFNSKTARLSDDDIGKTITVKNSTVLENNRDFLIASVPTNKSAFTTPPMITDSNPFIWEIRGNTEDDPTIIQVEVRSGFVDDIAPGWIVRDGLSEFEVVSKRYFKNSFDEGISLTEREGLDAIINASGQVVSNSSLFKDTDIGHPLSITGSSNFLNIQKIEIGKIISSTIAEPTSEFELIQDGGPLSWAIFPYPILHVRNTGVISGVIQQEGLDLEITSSNGIFSGTANFTNLDIGNKITIRSSNAANNDIFEIETTGPSSNEATVTVSTLVVESGPLTWELRTPTKLNDETKVQVNSSPMIDYLAYNKGLTIDKNESELRQRSYIANHHQWIDKKSTFDGYHSLARQSGFDLEVRSLYHVGQDIAEAIPTENIFEIDTGVAVGRSGIAGELLLGSIPGQHEFYDPTALFTVFDVDSQILLEDTSGGNNRRFTISSYVNLHTVRFRAFDSTGTAPDPSNENISWRIFKLYTDLPPEIPLYDEVNIERMQEIVGNSAFGIDKYCWESDFNSTVDIVIDSAVLVGTNTYQLTLSGGEVDVVVSLGVWKITTEGGNYFLESMPVDIGGGLFTCNVVGTVAPPLGAAFLSYVCKKQLNCNYCASSKLLFILTADTIADESGDAISDIYKRTLYRLETEGASLHTKIIPWFISDGEGELSLEAEIES